MLFLLLLITTNKNQPSFILPFFIDTYANAIRTNNDNCKTTAFRITINVVCRFFQQKKIKMVKCCIRGCTTNAKTANPLVISLHRYTYSYLNTILNLQIQFNNIFRRFPRNLVEQNIWKHALQNGRHKFKDSSKICSLHFAQDDIVLQFGRRTIKQFSIPKLNMDDTHLIDTQSSSLELETVSSTTKNSFSCSAIAVTNEFQNTNDNLDFCAATSMGMFEFKQTVSD